jgi:hypothetical protein
MLDNISRGVPKIVSSYIYRSYIEKFVLDISVVDYIYPHPTPL